MIYVRGLEDGNLYGFDAKTSYDALKKMKYYLNLTKEDPNCRINKSRKYLYLEHCGNTYVVKINNDEKGEV